MKRIENMFLVIVALLCTLGCAGKKPYTVDWQRGPLDALEGSRFASSLSGSYPLVHVVDQERRLYFGTRGGAIQCIDEKNGLPIWRTQLKDSFEAAANIFDGVLYIGSIKGLLYAVEIETGRVLWSFESDGEILAPPVVFAESVIFFNSVDEVFSLDRKDGGVQWRHREPMPEKVTLRGLASMVMDNGNQTLLVGFSQGTLVALEASTGREQWRQNVGRSGRYVDIDSDPLVIADQVIVVSASGPLSAFDRSGTLLWSKSQIETHVQMQVRESSLIVATSDKKLMRLDMVSGDTVWERDLKGKRIPTSMLIDRDYILIAVSGGWLEVYSADSGTFIWRYKLGRRLAGRLVSAPDQGFYALNGKQTLFRFQMH